MNTQKLIERINYLKQKKYYIKEETIEKLVNDCLFLIKIQLYNYKLKNSITPNRTNYLVKDKDYDYDKLFIRKGKLNKIKIKSIEFNDLFNKYFKKRSKYFKQIKKPLNNEASFIESQSQNQFITSIIDKIIKSTFGIKENYDERFTFSKQNHQIDYYQINYSKLPYFDNKLFLDIQFKQDKDVLESSITLSKKFKNLSNNDLIGNGFIKHITYDFHKINFSFRYLINSNINNYLSKLNHNFIEDKQNSLSKTFDTANIQNCKTIGTKQEMKKISSLFNSFNVKNAKSLVFNKEDINKSLQKIFSLRKSKIKGMSIPFNINRSLSYISNSRNLKLKGNIDMKPHFDIKDNVFTNPFKNDISYFKLRIESLAMKNKIKALCEENTLPLLINSLFNLESILPKELVNIFPESKCKVKFELSEFDSNNKIKANDSYDVDFILSKYYQIYRIDNEYMLDIDIILSKELCIKFIHPNSSNDNMELLDEIEEIYYKNYKRYSTIIFLMIKTIHKEKEMDKLKLLLEVKLENIVILIVNIKQLNSVICEIFEQNYLEEIVEEIGYKQREYSNHKISKVIKKELEIHRNVNIYKLSC